MNYIQFFKFGILVFVFLCFSVLENVNSAIVESVLSGSDVGEEEFNSNSRSSTFEWTGVVDTDWHNENNWMPIGLPDPGIDMGTNVLIPIVLSDNYPVITDVAGAKSIFIEDGASLTLDNSGSLLVEGSETDGIANFGEILNHGSITVDSSFQHALVNHLDAQITNHGSITLIEGQGSRLINHGAITNHGSLNVLSGIGTSFINHDNSQLINQGNFFVHGGEGIAVSNFGNIVNQESISVIGGLGTALINQSGAEINNHGSFFVAQGEDGRVVNFGTLTSTQNFNIEGGLGAGLVNHVDAVVTVEGSFSVNGGSDVRVNNLGRFESLGDISISDGGAGSGFHNGPNGRLIITAGTFQSNGMNQSPLYNEGYVEMTLSTLQIGGAGDEYSSFHNLDTMIIRNMPENMGTITIGGGNGSAIDNHNYFYNELEINATIGSGMFAVDAYVHNRTDAELILGPFAFLNIRGTDKQTIINDGYLEFGAGFNLRQSGAGIIYNSESGEIKNYGPGTLFESGSSVDFHLLHNLGIFENLGENNFEVRDGWGNGIRNSGELSFDNNSSLSIRNLGSIPLFNESDGVIVNYSETHIQQSAFTLIQNEGKYTHLSGEFQANNSPEIMNNSGYVELNIPLSFFAFHYGFTNSDSLIFGNQTTVADVNNINSFIQNETGGYLYLNFESDLQHLNTFLLNQGKAILGPDSDIRGSYIHLGIENQDSIWLQGSYSFNHYNQAIDNSGFLELEGQLQADYGWRGINITGGEFHNMGIIRTDSISSTALMASGVHEFFNHDGAEIHMEYIFSNGIENLSGYFSNNGFIGIAATDTLDGSGIINNGEFFNQNTIEIGFDARIRDDGITNQPNGQFTNRGFIRIGESGVIHGAAISNANEFINDFCGEVSVMDSLYNEGNWENYGTLEIDTGDPHINTGTFTNFGDIVFIQAGSIPNLIEDDSHQLICPDNFSICGELSAYDLNQLSPTPEGGFYVGPEVNNDILNPSLLSYGVHEFEYHFERYAGCFDICNFEIELLECFFVQGSIIWNADSSPIPFTDIHITGDLTENEETDVSGIYELLLPKGGDYIISPEKTGNQMNGVDIADILAIQQHVTFLNRFTDPYQLIAADVSGDGFISTFDAAIIGHFILDNPAAIALFDESWRFVPADFTFSDPENPWDYTLSIEINDLEQDISSADFIGIKVGDVTGDADPSGFMPNIPTRDLQDNLSWRVSDNQWAAPGELLEVKVKSGYFQDFASWQMALQFDASVVELVEVLTEESALNLGLGNFGTYSAKKGELRALWSNSTGKNISLAEDDYVFTLVFRSLTHEGKISDYIWLEDAIIPARAYNQDFQLSGVELEFVEEEVVSVNDTQVDGFRLLQNRPNPFSHTTVIGFEIPQSASILLQITDISGKLVESIEKDATTGYNEIRLDADLPSGMYFYELITPYGSLTNRMIVE